MELTLFFVRDEAAHDRLAKLDRSMWEDRSFEEADFQKYRFPEPSPELLLLLVDYYDARDNDDDVLAILAFFSLKFRNPIALFFLFYKFTDFYSKVSLPIHNNRSLFF